MMPATPNELDAAIRAVARKIRNEREHQGDGPKYRCPECGSDEVRTDGEIWLGMNPNTGEVLTDILSEPARMTNDGGPEGYITCEECGHESDHRADFDTTHDDYRGER